MTGPLAIMKLKRNDLEGILAFWRQARTEAWWSPEYASSLIRLFDNPAEFIAATRTA